MLLAVNGTRLHVEQCGSEHAPALLYIHGGPGMGTYDFLAYQGERLSRRLRLVTVDQRGVEQSDPLEGPVNEFELLADFEAVRQQLGIEHWAVLGHSYGGHLALRYAVEHPGSVSKAIFENPGWDLVLITENLLRVAGPLLGDGFELPDFAGPSTRELWDERIAILSGLGERRMGLYFGPDNQGFVFPSETGLSEEIQDRADRFADELTRSDSFHESLLPYLARLSQPALLVTGEYDPVTSDTEVARFHADVRNGSSANLLGVGHFPHLEVPERFAELVTEFVLR